MYIYLVRHGESKGNKNGFHQGPDVPLSKEGINQARILAERLKKHAIDTIYSSPMLRAKQTSEVVSKKLKIPVKFIENLKEIRNPSKIWGKPVKDKKILKIRKIVRREFLKGNSRYLDEETFEELNQRAKRVLDHLLTSNKKQSILCVSHASMIKIIVLKALLGKKLSPEIFLQLREHMWINNTGITVLEYRTKTGWMLLNWDDTAHL